MQLAEASPDAGAHSVRALFRECTAVRDWPAGSKCAVALRITRAPLFAVRAVAGQWRQVDSMFVHPPMAGCDRAAPGAVDAELEPAPMSRVEELLAAVGESAELEVIRYAA